MHVTTLPVYSRLANPETIPAELQRRIPPGFHLSHHQVETFQALTHNQYDVIFNTAMTGDGKSLAGQLPALVHGLRRPLLAMYPTNELVNDQQAALRKTTGQWGVDLYTGLVNSARLDEIMMLDDYRQRGEAILGLMRNHDVLLTNPDIFHLIMHQFYTRKDDAPDKILSPLIQRFPQFNFDEFHIFDAPQIVSVLNALLFTHEVSGKVRPHHFLFLSATPGELMLEYLHRSGLSVKEIQGEYLHSEGTPDPSRWRQILQQATIHFDSLRVEEWIARHTEDILIPFFQENRPGAKGAIIVNSVASVYRLLNRLQPILKPLGLTIEPNTGLTSRSRRAISYQADILLGTSTVDVGVDFQINFLLFESRDAGSFLQRLGRLGRHKGYQRDGVNYPFENFVAYALVPPWIQESLFQGFDGGPARLQNGEIISREQFNQAVQEAYPLAATFDNYANLWGKFQCMRILSGLSKATVKDQYRDTQRQLEQRYDSTYKIRLRNATKEYIQLFQDQRALLNEAISFRGGSYFTCCLIDETESGPDRFKTADLFQLLPNAYLEYEEEDAFYQAAAQAGLQKRPFERQNPLGYYRLKGWRDERADYSLMLDRDLLHWDANRFGKAEVIKGFKIIADLEERDKLNNRLCRREIPALLCAGYTPFELKQRLRLPLLFAIYPFSSRDNVSGSVAFGREALLLQTRLPHSSLNCGGGAIFT